MRLVVNNIPSETGSTTLRTTLGQVVLAARSYVAPSRRTQTLEAVADALWAFAQSADPASDAQFQFVKFFAQVASTPSQLDAIDALLTGDVELEGLTVDTDLRWELLFALVAGGRAGTAEIDAALAADATASGEQQAAHARAAIPTIEAKQAAWSSVVDEEGKPNAIIRSTAAGFVTAHDPQLLAPFVETYFASLFPIWDSRSYHIAEELIEGLFPAVLADEHLRSAAQAWHDAHAEGAERVAPPALRRLVIEGLADVERALAAQAVDAQA